MRYVVSGVRRDSTIVDELDVDAADPSRAAIVFLGEAGYIPQCVEQIEEGEVIESHEVNGWCDLCDAPIFDDQDWIICDAPIPPGGGTVKIHSLDEDCYEA